MADEAADATAGPGCNPSEEDIAKAEEFKAQGNAFLKGTCRLSLRAAQAVSVCAWKPPAKRKKLQLACTQHCKFQ